MGKDNIGGDVDVGDEVNIVDGLLSLAFSPSVMLIEGSTLF